MERSLKFSPQPQKSMMPPMNMANTTPAVIERKTTPMPQIPLFVPKASAQGADVGPFTETPSKQGLFSKLVFGEKTTYTRTPETEMEDPDIPAPGHVPEEYRQTLLNASKKGKVNPQLSGAMFQQESSYNPNAVDPSTGGKGIAQISPNTAKDITKLFEQTYGRKPNFENPNDNLTGGVLYLNDLYKRAGNWPDALVAYHRGLTGTFQAKRGEAGKNINASVKYLRDVIKHIDDEEFKASFIKEAAAAGYNL